MKHLVKYNLILLFGFTQILFAQEIKDVSFEVSGEQIIIYYSLNSNPGDLFDISIHLKRLNDQSFDYVPQSLTGDIGDDQSAGIGKIIKWDVDEDEMAMFDGDDFYFEVFAEKIKPSGGIPWYYYAGTAAVGGAVAAVLLGGSSDKSATTATKFPQPPGRP